MLITSTYQKLANTICKDRVVLLGVDKENNMKSKIYVRAAIFEPHSKKFLFTYFENYHDNFKWGLVGGKVESENYEEELKREIIEETGYTDFDIVAKLGDPIQSRPDPDYDSRVEKKVNYPYLVILNSRKKIKLNKSETEKTLGMCVKFSDPSKVNFPFYYLQYQEILNRAIEVVRKLY